MYIHSNIDVKADIVPTANIEAIGVKCDKILSKTSSNYPVLGITGNIAVLNNDLGVKIQKNGSNKMFIHDNIDFYSDINSTSNITCINLTADNMYNKTEVDALIAGGGGEVGLTDYHTVEDYDLYAHKVQRFAGSDNFTQNRHMNVFDKHVDLTLTETISDL